MSGLVYEVAWVRLLGNALGNTVHSASLVTAAYMCGLGIGSYLAGGWADRRVATQPAAPLRAYGICELCIAAMGLGLATLLPHLGGVSAEVSAYARTTEGWFEPTLGSMALRYGMAAGLLFPPTLLMGATFTLLVRHVLSHEVRDAGWRVGALYGANTAGAAAGALLTDLVLVPAWGIFRAETAAAIVQTVVGVAALVIATTDEAPVEARAGATVSDAPGRTLAAACGALFLSGFAALGMEIVWFRSLSCSLGAFRAVFSIVLAVILAGIWLGSMAGGYAHRRYGRPLELFLISQALFVVTALLLMATYTSTAKTPVKDTLESTLRVVLCPALLMGFSMPLANAIVQDTLGRVGQRAGALYLANTAGSVAGSLVAGFVFAGRLDSQQSFGVFAACAAVAPLPLVVALATVPRSVWIASMAGAALVVPASSAWLALPEHYLVSRFFPPLPPDRHVLAIGEGVSEIIEVAYDAKGARWLITNGHPMSANSLYAQRYMRAFAHIPLAMMDRPESALVICFGVGNTLHATSLHSSIKRLEVADLSRNVLEHAGYFRATNHDVLMDPRLRVFVDDGRQHLRTQEPDTYDLVTLEPPPISFAGVSALYSREFYALAKSRLKPGGFMTQWLPAYQVPPETALQMVRAFVDVFPNAVLLSGEGTELILMGSRRPRLVLDLDQVEKSLREEPAVAADLTRVNLGTLTEIAGMFVAGPEALQRVTSGVTAVTDDRPSTEYTFWRQGEVPAELFVLEGLRSFCPGCFEGPRPAARVPGLDTYQEALKRVYAVQGFRQNDVTTLAIDTRGGVDEMIERDPYLRSLLGVEEPGPDLAALRAQVERDRDNPQAHFALAYALARAGSLAQAIAEQRRGLELAPRDADAHYNLAAIEGSLGHEDLAIREAEIAVALDPEQAGANAMLCTMLGARGDPRASEPCRRARGR
jgi:predicted membrane-bound spermidine synthase